MPAEHPYRSQPAKAFWKQTVSNKHFLEIPTWYKKKWSLDGAQIAAAGSCFAQHIGRQLRSSGFQFLDVEPPPGALKEERWLEHGYRMYSARYGNVYSPRQLLQLLQRALGELTPQERPWTLKGGFADPFRPTIQPQPFSCVEEVLACQSSHLAAVARLFESTDVFVFTLGLTEAWACKTGEVLPVCPGTHGGKFDAQKYGFVNFGYGDIVGDLQAFMDRARSIKKDMRFLFTVSPVPLVATATTHNVVVATTYSKSVLRAAAGFLAETHEYADYFPSYEIISSPVMRGAFFEADMRSVSSAGVQHVMSHFFREHEPPPKKKRPAQKQRPAKDADEVACDEVLLSGFGEGKK